MILGSYPGAFYMMIQFGRRDTLLYCVYCGMLGILIQMFEVTAIMCIGRLIFGLSAGVICVVGSRLIEETVPERLVSLILPIFFVGSGCSKLIAHIISTGLPNDDDIEGLKITFYWRMVIFFPLFLQVALFFGLHYWVPLDSPKYYIMIQDFNKAKKSIELIYSEEEDHDVILNEVIHTVHLQTRSLPFKDLYENPLYRRNTLFLGILAGLHELTGYNIIHYEIQKVV